MFDFWQSFLGALESVAVLPSIMQALLPSISSPNSKRAHNVVRASDRNMDSFFREVRRLFEAPLRPQNLLAMSAKLQASFEQKLQDSHMCMLPSFNHTLPTGNETGTYLALDVGGSTFRVALVELCGKQILGRCMRIIKMQSYKINDPVRALEGREFFNWMAEKIEETLADPIVGKYHREGTLPMGLSWSFPVEQTSIRSGTLIDMGKGFCACHGLVGQDLSDLIMQACNRRNLNVRMDAIVNDSTATLLSRAYQDQATRMALILGTGMNAAVNLPVTAIAESKFGDRPQTWHDKAKYVLVNTEMSMFGKHILPTTRWDDYLNTTHARPDFQPFEHVTSGRYLGEIVRLVLLEAIQTAGLFRGEIPHRLSEPYSLETDTIARIESDDSYCLTTACTIFKTRHPLPSPPNHSDIRFVRKVCHLVSQRAAAYLAVGIHALWSLRNKSENFSSATVGKVTIGCNGSVIEKYPGYKQSCQSYLSTLTHLSGGSKKAVALDDAIEAAIFGAAVAASLLDEEDIAR